MDFLEVLETIKEGSARSSKGQLLEGAGVSVRNRAQTPRQKQALLEATKLLERVYRGETYAKYLLQEAMTTSDFPLLFGQILDRTLLAGYAEQSTSWEQYTKLRRVKDFREVASYTFDGAEGVLSEVNERAEYEEAALSEAEYKFRVKVYGRILDLSFQMLVNDDLDAFRDLPQRSGKAARRTEERLVSSLFVGTAGPNANLYSVGNANILTGNPVLNITSLGAAVSHLMSLRDADDEPITVEAMTLVTGPGLHVAARNLLDSKELRITVMGGDTNQQLVGASWANEMLKQATNFQIPKIATTNAATSWWLFADPNKSRPALQAGKLIGFETPQVFMKKADAVLVSGNSAEEGDFENDARRYKVRHIFGAGTVDPKMTIASNGSGS